MKKKQLGIQIVAAILSAGLLSGSAYAAEDMDYGMEDVVVTAEKIPTKRAQTPANVAVVTAEEIAGHHYQDVAEALNHVNGVNIVKSGADQQHVVTLNGDSRVIVMLNGRRLNNDQGFSIGRYSVDLNQIPTVENIERIEIVKGGASALYGSDAVGGVINVITKKDYGPVKFKLQHAGGSWGNHTYSLTGQGSEKYINWFMYGALEKQSYKYVHLAGNDYSSPESSEKNNRFAFNMIRRIDDTSSVALDFEHTSIHTNLVNFRKTGNTYGFNTAGRSLLDENFNNVGVTFNFKEGTAAPGYLRFYHNYSWIDNFGAYNTTTNGLDYQNGWQLDDNNTLIAGFEFKRSISSNVSNSYEDKTINNRAYFVQDTMKLGDKWTFVPGLRADKHDSFGTHWSPKAALNYQADDKLQLYANWGRVFKAPTADDMFYNVDMSMYGYGKFIGNPNLKPESGYTQSVGANYTFTEGTTLGVNVFQSEIHDAIAWQRVGGDSYMANNQNEKKSGIELNFDRRINDNWSYQLGYTYTNCKVDTGNGNGLVRDTEFLQPNGYHAAVTYKNDKLYASLEGRYATGLDNRSYNNSCFHVWDLNVSYDINKNRTVFFKVNNLTNSEYYLRSGLGTYYPGTGRFFQIGMSYNF